MVRLPMCYRIWYLQHLKPGHTGKVCQPDESPTFVETWLGMEKLLASGGFNT
jgi:hypothetical protein